MAAINVLTEYNVTSGIMGLLINSMVHSKLQFCIYNIFKCIWLEEKL